MADRNVNSTMTSQSDKENYQPKMLSSKIQSSEYISPSDAILSPATQKLAAFKGKKLGKGLKPQTLFAKAMNNQQAAKNATQMQNAQSMFKDVSQTDSSQSSQE